MRKSETEELLLHILDDALQESIPTHLTDDVITEAKQQAVFSLVCPPSNVFPIIATNVHIMWEQQKLSDVLNGIPYFVLKGSCASIYYPEPLRRTLGDIDILVSPCFFLKAYNAFISSGYATDEPAEGDSRHVHFYKNGIKIELHRRFAILQTEQQEQLLDNWLYQATPSEGRIGKSTFPMPDEQLNGLVLLAHINQHLESGLGLRHLVDWVMYVRHSLDDTAWPFFQEKTDMLGLTKLARVIAKFGQMYLGLSEDLIWCKATKERTVEDLLDFVFQCGNFGNKDVANNTMVMVMSHGRGIRGFFRNLQIRGEANWGLLKNHPRFKPLAWAYQACRYLRWGVGTGGIKHLIRNVTASKSRNKLMDELGVTRFALKK